MNTTINLIERRIAEIKRELMLIGPMRPGSISQQTRGKKQTGKYYQLSYTHRMKGHTEYVRHEWADQTQRQIANYRHFKKLINEWISLAINHAKMTMAISKRSRP
jgi:hypothetical protein